jgi:hypothetical protein
MIASRLDTNSSSGICCLLGASGREESLAPKKMVWVVSFGTSERSNALP